MSVFWFVLFAGLLIFELATMGLYTVWFAIGALAATGVSMGGGPVWLQVVVFFVLSLALLLFTRPYATKYFNKSRTKTNVDTMLGRTALVTKEIDNQKSQGEILYEGMPWSARSVDDKVIPEGSQAEIQAVEGVKALVREVRPAPENAI